MCNHDNSIIRLREIGYSLIFILPAIVLWALSSPAPANTASACGSDVGVYQCSANGAGAEESTPDPASSNTVRQAPAGVRHYNSSNSAYDFGMGRGWAATFLANLQFRNRQGAALVQGNGRRINFREPTTVIDPDGTERLVWQAFALSDGTLHIEGDHTLWSLPDGRRLKFKDQFLVNIDFPGPGFLKLFYVNKRIDNVTDEYGSQLHFDYYPNHVTFNPT